MRKLWLLVLLIALTFPTVVSAQSSDPSCGALSAADCKILTASQGVMSDLNSAAFNMVFTFFAHNVPEGEFHVVGAGTGAYTLNVPAWNNRLSFANARAFINYLVGYLSDASASLDLTFSMQSGADSEAMVLQMRLVDSVGYINTDGLRSLMGGGGGLSGWIGIELEALLRYMLDSDSHAFDAYLHGSDLTTSGTPLGQQYATIARIDSLEPDFALFETRVKLADLLDDPAVADAMQQQLDEALNGVDAQVYISFLQLLVGDSDLVTHQKIRLSDNYLQSFVMSYDLQLSRFIDNMLFADETDSAKKRDPLSISLYYSLDYTQFNAAPRVTVPNDVFEVFGYDDLRRLVIGGGAQL